MNIKLALGTDARGMAAAHRCDGARVYCVTETRTARHFCVALPGVTVLVTTPNTQRNAAREAWERQRGV